MNDPKTRERELNGFKMFQTAHRGLYVDEQIVIVAEPYLDDEIPGVEVVPFYTWAGSSVNGC